MNQIRWKIFLRTALLSLGIALILVLIDRGWYFYLILAVPLVLWLCYEVYQVQARVYSEFSEFVESVHYRDFSRYFNVRQAPLELQNQRKGFNEIIKEFKILSREKETQYQYLQRILEMIETGILSYEESSGEVLWINESLRKMLGIPYLKGVQALSKRDEMIYREMQALKPGDSKIVSMKSERTSVKVLLTGAAFQTDGKKYKLIAFQNINEALDETESKAWQKLLSVLTHEIMNSVAPISSLADTLKTRLEVSASNPLDDVCTAEDIKLGIETIKRRSEGLLKFAEIYRSLNKITTLNLTKIYVRDLFENLYQLMQPTLGTRNIEMDIILKDPGLQMEVDTNLVEQVLINLVLNAIDAVKAKEAPLISLSAYLNPAKKIVLQVADNGYGIPAEVMDQIFVPFFSTKKNGSGIGLSLCKQIMLLHRGNIKVQSREGEGTVFILQF